MKRLFTFILFLTLSAGAAVAAGSIPLTGLTPEKDRITDSALSADRELLARTQDRLAAVNNSGTAIGSYHFAKAQAWLDFAADTYNENDRSPVVENALFEALTIIQQLEQKTPREQMGMTTSIMPESMRLREDLWSLAESMKKNTEKFPCVEPLVAQLEVQLVWAGHEQQEMGWRHSKPYLQAAERLADKIRSEANLCNKPPTPAVCPVCPQPLPVPAPIPVLANAEIIERLPDRIHFALDQFTLSTGTIAILEKVAHAMRQHPEINLVIQGHTDKRGKDDYNLKLSRSRALAVRDYLTAAGISTDRMTIIEFGSSKLRFVKDSIEEHARNRRVELLYTWREQNVPPRLEIFEQNQDVQLEGQRKATEGKGR